MNCWEVQIALTNKATQIRKTDCHTAAFLSYFKQISGGRDVNCF